MTARLPVLQHFDGMTDPPDDLKDPGDLPNLARALEQAGFTNHRIEKFFNENAIQVVDLSDEVYRRANGTIEDIIIKNDGHPNEQGALLISEVTWGVLSKLLTDLPDRRQ